MYLLTCARNDDLNQPAHPRSMSRVCCHQEETLHPWLSKLRPVKILIRLRECAVWSESSLGADIQRYVFWCCDPYKRRYSENATISKHDLLESPKEGKMRKLHWQNSHMNPPTHKQRKTTTENTFSLDVVYHLTGSVVNISWSVQNNYFYNNCVVYL